MRRIFVSTLLLILVFFLVRGGSEKAIARKAEAGERVVESLGAPVSLFERLFSGGRASTEIARLLRENENLRAQIFEITTHPAPVESEGAVKAQRYSTYPFNIHDLITIRAGAKDGVVEGAPVTVESHLFLGQVVEVEEAYSVVRTIFDDEFRLAVKIGEAGIEALLEGGRKPRLTLIDKNAKLVGGETVWTADRKAPFGLLVGEVEQVRYKTAEAFQTASVQVSYELGDVQTVMVRIP